MDDNKARLDRQDEPLPRGEQDLTPPHGDDLRSEETFGRTDRYSNLDDETADRELPTEGGELPPEGGSHEAPATNTGETLGSTADPDDVDRRAP